MPTHESNNPNDPIAPATGANAMLWPAGPAAAHQPLDADLALARSAS
tara:strand:+ start:96 stop:236 length:141 start_codon:yes stop_codon:yes gene_type:complete